MVPVVGKRPSQPLALADATLLLQQQRIVTVTWRCTALSALTIALLTSA
jgi:hypothetical protein